MGLGPRIGRRAEREHALRWLRAGEQALARAQSDRGGEGSTKLENPSPLTSYFDETGDTDATSPENDTAGGWGSVLKLTQKDPSANTGTLTLFYKPDQAHTGLDNVAFLSKNVISFVEDAGDTLHGQRNALDSAFAVDVTTDYGNPANAPVRWLAEGRDAWATLDAANAGFGKNDDGSVDRTAISCLAAPRAFPLLAEAARHPFCSSLELCVVPCGITVF